LGVLLVPAGRNANWQEGQLYQSLATAGYPVCVPDVRGIGDLTAEFSRGAARYARSHNGEESYTWASLMLGKPLLGQRVTDILAVLSGLRGHSSVAGRRLILAAQGKMTVPAEFAAALDPKIDSLYLSGGLVSYRSILDTEQYAHPFANFLPGVLKHIDLPEVVASLAPRRVIMAGVVDGGEKAMDVAAVRSIHQKAANVQILPRAQWDLASFQRL
jgi:hypothetical protein